MLLCKVLATMHRVLTLVFFHPTDSFLHILPTPENLSVGSGKSIMGWHYFRPECCFRLWCLWCLQKPPLWSQKLLMCWFIGVICHCRFFFCFLLTWFCFLFLLFSVSYYTLVSQHKAKSVLMQETFMVNMLTSQDCTYDWTTKSNANRKY